MSSAALTRVFTHIYLRDPNIDLDSLLEPASGERAAAATEAVKGRAEALLGKFRAFNTKPKRSAASPAAHKANLLRAAPPPASDSVVAPVLLLIPAHVPCLGEALKLALGVVITVWTIIFAFEFPEICAIPSYLLMFYAGRARPRAYLIHR